MKKAILLLLTVLLSASMCACTEESRWKRASSQYEESGDVRMETQYAVYPEGTLNVIVKWFNESEYELTGGESFILEKQVNGVWRTVEKETDINYAFNSIGYSLPQGGSYWQGYGLIPYTDGLNAGEYRISSYVIVDYPRCIQIYGYFEVGGTAEPRDVTCDENIYEYVNTEYGFVLKLPPDWEGCAAETVGGTGDDKLDQLAETIDQNWFALRVRHPDWSEDAPYQDITFACVSLKEWNSGDGLDEAIGTDYDKLPERVSTDSWMLMIAENTLDSALDGYDAAKAALDTMTPIR